VLRPRIVGRSISGSALHVVEGGRAGAPPIVFLHGWPQSSAAFAPIMRLLGDTAHTFAVDLPGIGGSKTPPRSNDKRTLAGYVHQLIEGLGLRDVTLVGHDVGGMIAFAYVREYPIARAAILDVVIPGIEPWSKVIANPSVWHFGFHAVANLPETMVSGREAPYFDFFFDAIAASPTAIGAAARATYVAAYATPSALHTGFEWYRAFAQDAKDNAELHEVMIPVLYVRGDREYGELAIYLRGLQQAGFRDVRGAMLTDCGHFSPDEQPQQLANALCEFIGH
jgi:pimeloyl-ACP methyl ester carboxylesterase